MSDAISTTQFNFPNQRSKYQGKVRDVYDIGERLVMIATDRISAFDVVLPRAIPHKGQVLNLLAAKALEATKDIVPNWVQSVPDPNVTIGTKCDAFPIEMVIRGYLVGHAYRLYAQGTRTICGVPLPEGMRENEKFPIPIITPTTKASAGHDEDISREEIIRQGLVSETDYDMLANYAHKLYNRGCEIAAAQGLILVDTKYEFGKFNGEIMLIDEAHTPDSSRYFYADTYEALFAKGEPQRQLSKEFVRQWLIENGFQGKEGQKIPEMTDQIVTHISERYIELYEKMTGEKFFKENVTDFIKRIKYNVEQALSDLG